MFSENVEGFMSVFYKLRMLSGMIQVFVIWFIAFSSYFSCRLLGRWCMLPVYRFYFMLLEQRLQRDHAFLFCYFCNN